MDIKNSKKILITLPDRLGDTLFRTPLLRLFATILPNAEIAVLAPTKISQAVVTNNPYVKEIPPLFDKKDQYDLIINTRSSKCIPEDIKTVNAKYIEYCSDANKKMHSAENFLQFFAKIFNFDLSKFAKHYDIFPQNTNFTYIEKIFAKNNISLAKEILIGFHLGCHSLAKNRTRLWKKSSHKKAWPLKNFIRLNEKLYKYNPNIRIILTGSKEEEQLGTKFCKNHPQTINLINQTSVLDLAALMTYLKLFLSNDTGAMHIACTTDINLIALFGATNPIITGPYPKNENRIVLHKPKISAIGVDEVFSNILRKLF